MKTLCENLPYLMISKKAVADVRRAEFARCQEQSTLKSGQGVSVSVKTREMQDPINEDLPD